MKKLLLGLGLLTGLVLIPHGLYAGSTRILDANQLRNDAALLSLPTATQTIVGTSETQTLTNKTLTSPAISTPTGIVKGDVGLGNVDNTSDATKDAAVSTLTNKTISGNTATNLINGSGTFNFNSSGTLTAPNATDTLVGKATTDTLTNKTLTSPVINTPTGIVKGDVGLGNVDNTSDATKDAATSTLTNKTLTSPAINTPNIDGGTASNTSRVTLPKDTLTNLTSLTRKEGNVFYATDQAKPYYDTGSALVAVGSGSGSGSAGYNTIQNTDAETDTSNWTESGGTFTRTNTSGELLFGAYSFKWTPSAAQNLRSSAVTIIDGLFGRNCYASVIYKTASTDYTMQVLDGSNNVLASYAMPAASTAKIAPVNFVCPTSGSIKLGFVTTASAVYLSFDSAFLGEATNITTSTNVTDETSYTPTLGAGFGSATNISFKYWRIGDRLHVKGTFTTGTTAASLGSITLPSGLAIDSNKITISNTTTNAGPQVGTFAAPNANYYGPIVTAVGTSTSLVYVGDQIANANKLTPQNINVVIGSTVVVSVNFSVPIQGWSAEPAFRPDLAAQSYSGHITSTSDWTTSSTSFVDVTVTSASTYTEDTNRNFGTVTQYASGSTQYPGVTFTPTRTGRYLACFTGSFTNSTTGSDVYAQLYDGTSVVVQPQMSRVYNGGAPMTMAGCGIMNVSSLSAINLRLQIKASANTAKINTGSTFPLSITINSMDAGYPAPVLLGSVTSNSSTARRIESVSFGGATEGTDNCTSSPCTMYRRSGGVGSVTRNSTGDYTVNFVSGTFSSGPTCVAMGTSISASVAIADVGNTTSTSTTAKIRMRNASNTAVDSEVYVICEGAN